MSDHVTDEQLKEMWPQASRELRGFASHLARTHAGITAAQIRMAVTLGDEVASLREHVKTLKAANAAWREAGEAAIDWWNEHVHVANDAHRAVKAAIENAKKGES